MNKGLVMTRQPMPTPVVNKNEHAVHVEGVHAVHELSFEQDTLMFRDYRGK
jgi:hypothetical protein